MSLRWYRRPRMVVLDRDAPALEAARTLENNNIGAVVVQHRGRVAGIVTDRDLAIRLLGRALDPRTTPIGEVMTPDVVTLTSADTQNDAIRLMQARNCRRIPLVDEGRVVGIVTLDDLLLDEAAPIGELAAIVEAQIGEGGPAPSRRSPSLVRSLARAEATYNRFLALVRQETGVASVDDAGAAVHVVLEHVVRRLTQQEGRDLIAQLPSLMQPELQALPPGPDKGITRDGLEAAMARRLGVDAERAAALVLGVGECVAASVSAGQIEDVRRQLPAELRDIFPDTAVVAPVGSRAS